MYCGEDVKVIIKDIRGFLLDYATMGERIRPKCASLLDYDKERIRPKSVAQI